MSSEKVFDYVVVGGGTAGCIVASRLTEDPEITVLLLEAGSRDINDYRVKVPGNVAQAYGSDLDWDYRVSSRVSPRIIKIKHKTHTPTDKNNNNNKKKKNILAH